MKGFQLRFLFWVIAFLLFCTMSAVARASTEASPPAFSDDQLEQLVAPIALYTDGLVAQIMMAATYPLQVVEAARWVEKNPDLKDDALQKAVEAEDWDPSVQSLVFFPDVLNRMSEDLDWTQDLGDAVLAQQAAVMDAVQRMRGYAREAGNLQSNEEQHVVVEETIIKIEPATQVVYVPAYNPTVVYGTYWGPPVYYYPFYSRPPSYWYPPGYVATRAVAFGVGVAVGAAIWGGCNWRHHDFYHRRGDVNINRNVNIDNSKNFEKWKHNPKNRGGVRYRDTSTREQFDNRRRESTREARIDRDAKRGYDRAGSRDIKRPASRDIKQPSTRDIQRPSTRDVQRPQKRDAQRSATLPSGGRSSAFKPGNKSFDRAAVNRGSSSRGKSARGGGGGRRR